jgi:UDP-hydrolysing UDP-N-acetyl-D-glucosamine 2-epimerase
MRRIQEVTKFELETAAIGMHFQSRQGLTWEQIEQAGFFVKYKILLSEFEATRVNVASNLSRVIEEMAGVLADSKPDAILVLGDRFEIFGAAIAAYVSRVPIIHFHGGELTEALIDEGFRHSISKLANLHLVATAEYERRVIQLGENPESVKLVGATGIESVIRLGHGTKSIDKNVIDSPIVMTYHPVSLCKDFGVLGLKNLLCALEIHGFRQLIITAPNIDPGSDLIRALLNDFAARHPTTVDFIASLGHEDYLELMSQAAVIVGNSSSGLLEGSAIGVPVLDVGERQRGRIKPPNVVSVPDSFDDILRGLKLALSDHHREIAAKREHPYGDGETSLRALSAIASFFESGAYLVSGKSFFDIDVVNMT